MLRLGTFGAALLLVGAAPPLTIAPVGEEGREAAAAYRRLWATEGAHIVAALERNAGVEFPPTPIEVLITPGRAMASYDGRTIRFRPAFSADYSRGTFVHELGHRLSFVLPRSAGLDDHRLLYLFLYDAWTDLWGAAFADHMVALERTTGPDYDAAWTWALAMTREERQAMLVSVRGQSLPSLGLSAS